MLDELIKAGKLTINDAEVYQAFQMSGPGRNWFQRKMLETFLEQPPPDHIGKDLVLFIDGRRSLLREIHCTLEHIQKTIKEYQHDHRRPVE